jgi:hypothetical protein
MDPPTWLGYLAWILGSWATRLGWAGEIEIDKGLVAETKMER